MSTRKREVERETDREGRRERGRKGKGDRKRQTEIKRNGEGYQCSV